MRLAAATFLNHLEIEMFTKIDKLIAAVLVPAVVWTLDAMGLSIPPDFAAELTSVLTAAAVWFVPNKA